MALILDIYDVNKMIKVNNLEEVTNPVSLDIGNVVTSDGLFSNTIFGRTREERSSIYAYIDLKTTFFQPLVYITLRKIFSKLDDMIRGDIYCKLDPKNYIIICDENDKGAGTGIKFFYDHWKEMKFMENASTERTEKIRFIKSLLRDEAFVDKWLVMPPFYRDMRFAGGKVVSCDVVNDYYSNLMRMSKVMERERNSGIAIISSLTRMRMQLTLVDIYNYIKNPPNLSKKFGILRSGVMGKSVDYAARLVISSPIYDQDNWDDAPVKFDRCGLPLGAVVTLFYPFFQNWLKSYFTKEFIDRKNNYPYYVDGELTNVELDNPEAYFTADYIDTELKTFVHSYGDRFKEVLIPIKGKGLRPIRLKIKGTENVKNKAMLESTFNRTMTWTDLLYRAACEITEDKTTVVTRYPLEDYFGVSGFKIHVLSTNNTIPVIVNGKLYKHYPIVYPKMKQQDVAIQFINTLIMANCFLEGYGADYDGDQVTAKGNFTKEANDEIRRIAMSKKNFLTISGETNRLTMAEALQAIYCLTQD